MSTVETVLLTDNDRHRAYTGVDKFHRAGYYGQRVKASSGENWSLSGYNPGGMCYDVLGIGTGGGHAVDTAATFFQVAPKAKLYMLYSTSGRYGTTYDSKFFEYSADVIDKEGINNMYVSLLCSRHKQFYEDLGKWMDEHPFFKWFWAAGNDSTSKYNPIMEIQQMFGVAAYTLMVSGEVVPAYYSSLSPYVDFAAPSMIRTNIKATKPSDSGAPNSGTSFSTPWLCGMMTLVDDFFIDKCGGVLTREAMEQFMLDHCIDMQDPGFDTKTGWGAVVLPDPSEIDIDKYWKIGRGTITPKEDDEIIDIGKVDDSEDEKPVVPVDGDVVKMFIDKFTDRDKISAWAVEGCEWAVKNGILTGIGGGKLSPDGGLTREQMAVILHRFFVGLQDGKLIL